MFTKIPERLSVCRLLNIGGGCLCQAYKVKWNGIEKNPSDGEDEKRHNKQWENPISSSRWRQLEKFFSQPWKYSEHASHYLQYEATCASASSQSDRCDALGVSRKHFVIASVGAQAKSDFILQSFMSLTEWSAQRNSFKVLAIVRLSFLYLKILKWRC